MRLRLLMSLLLVALAGRAGATTYLVQPDGSGDAPTIGAALALAVSGDVIELGDGVYHGLGNSDLDLGGRRLTLRSRSGDPAACVIDPEGDEAAPARCLSLVSGEDALTRIEGIGFRGAYAGGEGEAAAGGALRIVGGSPALVNCRFEGSEAWQGGAVACVGGAPTFADCVFEGNRARNGGGAVAALAGAIVVFTDCTFIGNSADYGGGLLADAATMDLTGCVLRGNAAVERGGGLYGGDHAQLSVDGCTLAWNGAPSGGGLALVYASTASVAGSIIAFGGEGEAVGIPWPDATASLSCSDLYGNAGGDWVGDIADQAGADGNLALDPAFCGDAADGDVGLAASSPCAAAQSGCGRMGAAAVGCAGRSAANASFSTLKSYY